MGIHGVPYAVGLPLTVLAIVFIDNAVNLIDGIDGLAASLSIVAFAGFAYIFAVQGIWSYAILISGIIGVLLAFLYFNLFGDVSRNRKIFMGDAGSLTLGFILGVLCVKYSMNNDSVILLRRFDFIVPFTLLVVPVFDAVRVSVVRISHGVSPFKADKRHIHHKAHACGAVTAWRVGVHSQSGRGLHRAQSGVASGYGQHIRFLHRRACLRRFQPYSQPLCPPQGSRLRPVLRRLFACCFAKGRLLACKRASFAVRFAVFCNAFCRLLQIWRSWRVTQALAQCRAGGRYRHVPWHVPACSPACFAAVFNDKRQLLFCSSPYLHYLCRQIRRVRPGGARRLAVPVVKLSLLRTHHHEETRFVFHTVVFTCGSMRYG